MTAKAMGAGSWNLNFTDELLLANMRWIGLPAEDMPDGMREAD